MISHCNWFLGVLFLIAALGAIINPLCYIAIAMLFSLMGLVLLPPADKLRQHYFNWQIKGGVKRTIVLMSFVLICLITPQVETDLAKISNPVNYLQHSMRMT
ncbi:MAG TPA: hypothetical protein V6C71_26780 [Coleofasciculaceae cyanobacterium]|jgi:uncharacterized membrane protein